MLGDIPCLTSFQDCLPLPLFLQVLMSSVGRGRWDRAQDGSGRLGTVYCDPSGPLHSTPQPFPSSPRMSALGTLIKFIIPTVELGTTLHLPRHKGSKGKSGLPHSWGQ